MHLPPAHDHLLARRGEPCILRNLADPGAADQAATLRDVGPRTERDGCERFSLVFVSAGAAPAQAIHAVTFADGERWDLFLVPVGRDDAGLEFEACFNRRLEQAQHGGP